jgi:hypothetical protein
MQIFNMEQGSKEWHKMRYGKVGGSTSKRLHVKGDDLLNELVACQLEPFDPTAESFQNEAMKRGNELEPFGRAELISYLGVSFGEVGWIQSNQSELLGISPDGVTFTDSLLRFACEIKCPSAKKHIEYIRGNEIPLEYIHQCCHYFAVIEGLEVLYFASYRPECNKPLFVKELRLTDEVNIGTAARPKFATVEKVVLDKVTKAQELESEIKSIVNQINF